MKKSEFPKKMKVGQNYYELHGDTVSGDADDWILSNLGIPSVTVELGSQDQYNIFDNKD